MNDFVNVWIKPAVVVLVGGLLLSGQGNSYAAPARQQRKIAHRPRITSLRPDGYLVEVGPDLGRDSTTHGAADNPSSLSLTVLGHNFQRGAAICWNDKPLPTKFISSSHLETVIPMDKLEDAVFDDPPQGRVTVVNRQGKIRASLPATFSISHWAMGG